MQIHSIANVNDMNLCQLCNRILVEPINRHHLIPLSKGGRDTLTIPMHVICHNKIHTVTRPKKSLHFLWIILLLVYVSNLVLKWLYIYIIRISGSKLCRGATCQEYTCDRWNKFSFWLGGIQAFFMIISKVRMPLKNLFVGCHLIVCFFVIVLPFSDQFPCFFVCHVWC